MKDLPSDLLKASEVLHWLGKYDEANALVYLMRLMNVKGIRDLAGLEALVFEEENPA